MGLSINQNIMAMNAYRNLSSTQSGLAKSLEKLSSGFRINRAADDAAGLAISEGLRSQVRGNKQAVRNAQDGISVVQTAEGALNEVHSILQRMRELAVQGANDSNDSKARDNIHTELVQLREELGRIGESTNFDGTKLLDGSASGTESLKFQVGANGDKASRINVDLADANISGLAHDLTYDGYQTTDDSSVQTKDAFTVADQKAATIHVGGKDYSYTMSSSDNAAKVAEQLQKALDAPATGVSWKTTAEFTVAAGDKYALEIGGQKLESTVTADSANPEAVVADLNKKIADNAQLAGKFEVSLTDKKIEVKSVGDDPAQNINISLSKTVASGTTAVDGEKTAGQPASEVAGKFKVTVDKSNHLIVSTRDGSAVPKDLVIDKDKKNLDLADKTVENSDPLSVKDHASAQKLVNLLDSKISSVSTARANLGAVQNRFEHTINNLNVAVENLSASESRIRDTDMANEMMQFTRHQILSQAGTAMLAQANQVPNGVLQLLR